MGINVNTKFTYSLKVFMDSVGTWTLPPLGLVAMQQML
jgi:hypothetical protein